MPKARISSKLDQNDILKVDQCDISSNEQILLETSSNRFWLQVDQMDLLKISRHLKVDQKADPLAQLFFLPRHDVLFDDP